ncbi:MAG TPA: hypothetical protein VGN26_03625 [Armatimonadota bacterium]|jgi:hypothetical protein
MAGPISRYDQKIARELKELEERDSLHREATALLESKLGADAEPLVRYLNLLHAQLRNLEKQIEPPV